MAKYFSLEIYFILIVDFCLSVTEFKVGVVVISKNGAPYDIERSGAAIRLAFDRVNTQILDPKKYRIKMIERTYGPACDAKSAPGNVTISYLISSLMSNLKEWLLTCTTRRTSSP